MSNHDAASAPISLAEVRLLRQWSTDGTPLPWAMEDERAEEYVIFSPSARAEIARVQRYQQGEADASYLVRAANAVPAMADRIEALAHENERLIRTARAYVQAEILAGGARGLVAAGSADPQDTDDARRFAVDALESRRALWTLVAPTGRTP